MRDEGSRGPGDRPGKLTCDPEHAQLVGIGIEWGRTAGELAEVMTLTDLFEVLSVYKARSEEMENRKAGRANG